MLYVESVGHESLRLAQRSITLRKVMQPVNFNTETGVHKLPPGWYIATLLTNTNSDPRYIPSDLPLDQFLCVKRLVTSFVISCLIRPERYIRNKLNPAVYPSSIEQSVSTFGHGYHACPGMTFSMTVFKVRSMQ